VGSETIDPSSSAEPSRERLDPDAIRSLLLEEQARLQQVRLSIVEEVPATESERDALAELSIVDQHPADVGTETFEQTKGLSILEQVEAQLRDVERALDRLDDGTYGVCEICGRPIEPARLEARPAARYCLEDQMAVEALRDVGEA
jgi:RNA polymerase-binding transcription factor DksA